MGHERLYQRFREGYCLSGLNPERENWIVHHVIPLLREKVSAHELSLIYKKQAVLYCFGNKNHAAKLLGVSRGTLIHLIKLHQWDHLKGNLGLEKLLDKNIISWKFYKSFQKKEKIKKNKK